MHHGCSYTLPALVRYRIWEIEFLDVEFVDLNEPLTSYNSYVNEIRL
jgi:hypothetical protein